MVGAAVGGTGVLVGSVGAAVCEAGVLVSDAGDGVGDTGVPIGCVKVGVATGVGVAWVGVSVRVGDRVSVAVTPGNGSAV